MYISMTGFSRTQLQQPWGTLNLEISSVNHRYQEISVRLPKVFPTWEAAAAHGGTMGTNIKNGAHK